jgi:hypothetical protein
MLRMQLGLQNRPQDCPLIFPHLKQTEVIVWKSINLLILLFEKNL